MKSTATLLTCSLLATSAAAFSGSSSFSGSQLARAAPRSTGALTMEYIPSGMSKEQWNKLKEKEQKNKKNNLGKVGITSFKSRTFDDWQKSGGKNLFPVDPNKAKSEKEIPYMQRAGGKADDSDLKKNKGGMFSFFGGKKKEEPEPEPEPEKKTNFWTF